jgi:hypothetical protein
MEGGKTTPIHWIPLLTTVVGFLHDDIWHYPKPVKSSFSCRPFFDRLLPLRAIFPETTGMFPH